MEKVERRGSHARAIPVVDAPRWSRHAAQPVFASRQAAAPVPPHSHATASMQPSAPAPAADARDASAEARVRAWYQARAAAAPVQAASATPVVADAAVPPPSPAKLLKAAGLPPAVPQTVADSSTEDDAAAIREESHIPSTAPTERVPLPFTHGELLAGVSPSEAGQPKPRVVPVPLLRSAAPAVKAVTIAAAKPKLDPQTADALAREALDDSDATGISSTALVGSTANAKLAGRPALAVLDEAPALRGDASSAADKLIAPMRGSRMILVHQNQMAVSDGLQRITNDSQLANMQRHRELVALPDSASMQPDGRLPLNRRYARPWTVSFLTDLARAHYARFHTPLIITSAVRTVAFQRHLVLVNGNAAPPTGDIASPHLYGQAVDLAKHGMSAAEIAWMRGWLTPVEAAGKIDVEEEFLQSCFHISVYRRYAPQALPPETPRVEEAPARRLLQAKATPARRRRISTALLAAGLR